MKILPNQFTPYQPIATFDRYKASAFDPSENFVALTQKNDTPHNPQGSTSTTLPALVDIRSRLREVPPLPPIADQSIAHLPFTHPGSIATGKHSDSYEQLEFVGDAYIELMATRLIYQRYKYLPVGRMSQIRELLVKNETLAEYSLAYKFDERASVPESTASGMYERKVWIKVLGDMFEAYVAAVILSDPNSGFATVEAWLAELWRHKLEERKWENQELDQMAKQTLAQKIMGRDIKLDYVDVGKNVAQSSEGKTWFTVQLYLTGWGWSNQLLGTGTGLSKANAGMRAAMQALQNPLTGEIGAVKRAHDDRVAAERLVLDGAMEVSQTGTGNGYENMA